MYSILTVAEEPTYEQEPDYEQDPDYEQEPNQPLYDDVEQPTG